MTLSDHEQEALKKAFEEQFGEGSWDALVPEDLERQDALHFWLASKRYQERE